MANGELQEMSKAEVIDRFQAFKNSVRSRFSRAEEAAGELQRKMVVGGVALLAGRYVANAQAQGTETLSLFGLSFEQTMALGLSAAEMLTDDRDLKRVVGGAADAFIAVAAYQAGQELSGREAADTGTGPTR